METTTYAAQHPDMTHALIFEGGPPSFAPLARRTAYIANAAMLYMLQHFDATLPADEWLVMEVPADFEPGDMFSV